ncbi:MAG: tetratricopeptide repeat protein [Bacteroidales bacterium]|nr:tetratricopeptide repeat protein [Bacteroidales bacterium]
MNSDRFENYGLKLKNLVLRFETMITDNRDEYFDVADLEIVMDFYLDSNDVIMLEKAVSYSELLFPDAVPVKLRKAQLLSIKGALDAALNILKDLEQIEPENSDVLYSLGVVFSQMEDHLLAIEYFQKASLDNTDLEAIYINLAQEYRALNQLENAIVYYKKALKENPDDDATILDLSLAYEALDMSHESIEYFRGFLSEHPYSKYAWFYLGITYLNISLYEKCVSAMDYALAIDEKFVGAYIVKSDCYRFREDYKEAVSILTDALLRINNNLDKELVYYNLGTNYLKMSNFDMSVIYLKKAVDINPYRFDSWLQLSISYAALEDFTLALDCLERALDNSIREPDFLLKVMKIYLSMEECEKAENLAIELFEKYPDNVLLLIQALHDFLNAGCYEEALRMSNLIEADDETEAELNMIKAVCHYKLGNKAEAYDSFRAYMMDEKSQKTFPQIFDFCEEMRTDLEIFNIITTNIMKLN